MSLFFAHGRLDALPPKTREALIARGEAFDGFVDAVRPIHDEVRARGDDALRELTARFDGAQRQSLEVSRDEIAQAVANTTPEIMEALRAAHDNIRRFHEAMRAPEAPDVEVVPGLVAGRRALPVSRAGLYVPGGRASYPSTVLMTATPARIAGVTEIIACTPPGPDGRVPDATLAAAHVAGVDRVFAVGGAQAIFAMAYGTPTVPRVQKIVGPGNAYVAAAKSLVAGVVATDAPAGPSEILVIADETANPEFIAWDLCAQAEHDPRACALLLTTSDDVARAVHAHVERILTSTPRASLIRDALHSRGALLTTGTLDEALRFADAYAPEHLSIQTRKPEADLRKVTRYGSAFLGPWSAVALGDYASGPNHVLPTAGLAASYAGLGVDDFLRKPTHQQARAKALNALAPIAVRLADLEGLSAHAQSARVRQAAASAAHEPEDDRGREP